jgi:hypothetical protein
MIPAPKGKDKKEVERLLYLHYPCLVLSRRLEDLLGANIQSPERRHEHQSANAYLIAQVREALTILTEAQNEKAGNRQPLSVTE